MTAEYKLKEESIYPYVGVYKDGEHETIVYFIAPKEGFCLASTDKRNTDPFTISNGGWNESEFKPLSEITIRARRIDDRRFQVRSVVLYAKDEVDAVRKYLRKKKPSEVRDETTSTTNKH